jgi:NADH dehydrogenase FAD-containing subunit
MDSHSPATLEMISPSNHFVFTPLIPSTAVGTLEFRAIQEPVRTLPSVKQYYQAKCDQIDFDAQTVTCHGLWDNEIFTIPYDKLVLAQGVKTNTFNTPNVAEREGIEVFFLKNLHHARGIRNRTIEMFEIAALPDTSHEERKRLLSFIIVGGGPTR